MQTNLEQQLDTIMEDLIVGHNFDYARKALLDWYKEAYEAGKIAEAKTCEAARRHDYTKIRKELKSKGSK